MSPARGDQDIDDLLDGPTPPPGPGPMAPAKRKDPATQRLTMLTDFWGHEDPGVFSWADTPPAIRHTALVRTQRFVEWFIATFDTREITPCWMNHPAAVAELWALERLHHATHTLAATDPAAPIVFYNQVPTTRARLRTDTGMDACTCEHTVPVRELPERVRDRRATYATNERWTATWAWPDVDDAGQATTTPPHARGTTR
ncbi:hypothetical protein AGMMS50218_15130 [Actinomycetota bacterium]|nr:hypothetical protein AGMMS50218_15130 [Actinomycetota bacterium]